MTSAWSVLSVNVGLPSEVRWRSRSVRTGIGKRPVQGGVRVGRLNLDGDGQADLIGHGGEHRAVLVHQRSEYAHWAGELRRDDLVPGVFGENLTVDGPEDHEICIGDRLRIGSALLEVTQPRVLCFKTGMALCAPRLPALMVRHGRPGFYCRVLEESVREVDALLYLPGTTPTGCGRRWRSRRCPWDGAGRCRPCWTTAEEPATPAWHPTAVRPPPGQGRGNWP
jgi:MOSC domain-containing protein YiiM